MAIQKMTIMAKRKFRIMLCTVLLIIGLCHRLSNAYEIEQFGVTKSDAIYQVSFLATVNYPSDLLIKYFHNIENIAAIIPAVEKVSVYKKANEQWVDATMRPCVLIFCKRIYKTSMIVNEGNQMLLIGKKNKGSFTFIDETIIINKRQGNTSSISYHSQFSLSFYIPSWLGINIMQSSLIKYLNTFLKALEVKYQNDLKSVNE